MTKRAKLLWVDLEMTGLDPKQDKIMEVAAIVTDWDFKEIAQYEAVVAVDAEIMKSRMVGDFWDTFNDVRMQLQAQNNQGKKSHAVEEELLEFISQQFDDEDIVLLAGNSIHQDRRFIASEWPNLDKRLHYRMLDVSAWKVVFDGKYNKRFAKPQEHRALEDIRGSIMEMKYYLTKVRIKE